MQHSWNRLTGGEGIIGDDGFGAAKGGEKGRFAAVGRADQRDLASAFRFDAVGRAFLFAVRFQPFLKPKFLLSKVISI